MKMKRFRASMMAFLLILCTIFSGTPVSVRAMTVLDPPPSPASNYTTVGLRGSYYSQAQAALDQINEYRKEACNAGNVPDPRNPSRMLTPEDYRPLKWSRDLESVARIRAAEGGIAFGFMDSGHYRLNDTGTFSISYNGISSNAEDLSYYNDPTMDEGILLWYLEKKDWVNQNTEKTTGHYTSIIDPDMTYIGLGLFYTEASRYPYTLAGELSATANHLDETMQDAPTDVLQKIEVSNDYIDSYFLDGDTALDTDTTSTLTPKIKLVRGNAVRNVWATGSFTYRSSDPKVATVSQDGVVSAIKSGTTTITATSNDGDSLTATVTVTCKHERKLISTTPSTCTTPGKKSYYCNICKDTTVEPLPIGAHDYVYGAPNSNGTCTGVCSRCGKKITINPPTKFSITWRNSTNKTAPYSETFPVDNPVGSTLYCCPLVINGDPDYQEMTVECSDPSIIRVPEKFETNIPNNPFEILKSGTVTLTFYPTYNSRLKQTFTVQVGDYSKPSIASQTIDGLTYTVRSNSDSSQSAYVSAPSKAVLSGTVKIPSSVTINKTVYTVTGLDSKAFAGQSCITSFFLPKTITMIESGAFANCTGLKSITFMNPAAPTIRSDAWTGINTSGLTLYIPNNSYGYGDIGRSIGATIQYGATCLHTLVIHNKVEATCTKPGNILYYECSECGKIFTDSKGTLEISPDETFLMSLGHDWETDFTIDVAPTATTAGKKSIHCKRCKARRTIVSIPAKGKNSSKAGSDSEESTNPTRPRIGNKFTANKFNYKVVSVSNSTRTYSIVCTGADSNTKTKLVIPNYVTKNNIRYKVTGISKKAFCNNKNLKSVTIGSNVTTIGAQAFYKCSSLRSIKINTTKLTKGSIGNQAFAKINKKAKVTVPAKKKSSYKKWFKNKGLNIR